MASFKGFKEFIFDVVFPPVCLYCRRDLERAEKELWLCKNCGERIPLRDALLCAACGRRIPDGKKICHREAPYRLGAASDYEHPIVKHLVWRLKYHGETAAARPLAALLNRYLARLPVDLQDYALVPIPLHRSRERKRGFNQATLIGELLAREQSFLLTTEALRRAKLTVPQAELKDRHEREANMSGAFAVADPEIIRGKKLILLDDVSTSGATLGEAAKVLKTAGAKDVIGLVIAKAGS